MILYCPWSYICLALFIDVVLLDYKPQYTWPGLTIVLLGIPVYYAWRPRRFAGRALLFEENLLNG